MNRTVQTQVWSENCTFFFFISVPKSSVFPANYLYMKLCTKWIKNHKALEPYPLQLEQRKMRNVRNKSVVMAARLPHRIMWICPLPKKPPSGPMVLAGAGITWVEEVTPWRRLTSVLRALSVSAERRTPSEVKRNFEDNESDSYKSGRRDFQIQILRKPVSSTSQPAKEIFSYISDSNVEEICQILTQAVTYLQSQRE